jgi:2-oxoglutarate ferredoxin oxidoreductase subunit delta
MAFKITLNYKDLEKGKKKYWCKSCGICLDVCPVSCLKFDRRRLPVFVDGELGDKCTGCKQCEKHCPVMAIEIDGVED